MWSTEIIEHMKDEEEFIGCFPYDKLPPIMKKTKNFSLIINTGNSQSLGEHWLAVKVIDQKCFYFDSFGLPIINEMIQDFLRQYGECFYSRVCVQDINSKVCGNLCIMFIKTVNNYCDYVKFINLFE